jgi:transposase-like protein
MDIERAYSPEFKAKVVLEFVRDQKSADQIYTDYDVPDDLLNRWTQEFLENAHLAFVSRKPEHQKLRRIEELERVVDRLTYDLSILKRALGFMSRVLSARKAVKSRVSLGKRRRSSGD